MNQKLPSKSFVQKPHLTKRNAFAKCHKTMCGIFVLVIQPKNHDFPVAIGFWILIHLYPQIIFCRFSFDASIFRLRTTSENKERVTTHDAIGRNIYHQGSLLIIPSSTCMFYLHHSGTYEVVAMILQELVYNGSLVHVSDVAKTISSPTVQ